jgi:hypothetical protein
VVVGKVTLQGVNHPGITAGTTADFEKPFLSYFYSRYEIPFYLFIAMPHYIHCTG